MSPAAPSMGDGGAPSITDSWHYGRVTFSYEFERRLRIGFIGCGGHSWRNVYPAFQYAPVELVAVADPIEERARACARQFGANAHYLDHREMLAREDLEAVFIVTDEDERGHPRFPYLAADVMRAGAHAWIEKPPAANREEVEMMLEVERQTGKFTMVGYKKMFFPSLAKVKEIISRPEEFGEPTQIFVRRPCFLPPPDERQDDRRMLRFLEHFFHPACIVHRLLGPVRTVTYQRDNRNGGSMSLLTFAHNQAVGVMHLSTGQSDTGPYERLEVVGERSHVVVDNGVRLTYYRKGRRGPGGYGRTSTYIGADDVAPITWEPEFSKGELYNKNLFTLGYVPEVAYFSECALAGQRPAYANLDDTLAMMRWYEVYRQFPSGQTVEIPEHA